MKNLITLAAAAVFTLTSCSDDDNAIALSSRYLAGGWEEIAPDPYNRILVFEGNSVNETHEDAGTSHDWDYTISGNTLVFGDPAIQHTVQIIDSVTMKVSNIYISGDSETGSETVTFKKNESGWHTNQ